MNKENEKESDVVASQSQAAVMVSMTCSICIKPLQTPDTVI